MQEIGDHLGHRSPNTTAGYAKINETTNEERLPVSEPAVVPLELRAGIIEGHWTPRAAYQAFVPADRSHRRYFDDGSIRQFDVAPLLDGPVFQPFKDVELFRHALT